MEDIFQRLSQHGVSRSELYLAWDFTVASQRNLTERLLHIRDQGLASLGGNAPTFNVTQVNEAPANGLRYEVRGTYSVPNFMDEPGVRQVHVSTTPTPATPTPCHCNLMALIW